jgi:uncharacterized membrane protein YecN with MAPEG domain
MTILNTAIYAALLGLVLLALTWNVMRLRRVRAVGIGHGEHEDLHRAIRAHGNFVEYVPMALILILSVELLAYRAWVVHALGMALVVGRIVHAYGLARSSGASTGRAVGIGITWLVIFVASVMTLIGALVGMFTAYE